MSAAVYRVRATIRTDWKSLVALAILVAVAGGAVLSSVGAARRTASAYAQMRDATNAWDVLVNPNNGSQSTLTMAEIRSVPGVVATGRVDGAILYPSFVRSVPDAFNLPPILVADDKASYTLGRPLMISGRQPAPSDPDGVWVDRTFAAAEHLKVGQTFTWTLLTPALLQRMQGQHSETGAKAVLASGVRSRAHIDGIGVTSDGVLVDPGYDPSSIWLTPAFRAAHPGLQIPYWGAMVRLKPGTSLDNFTARVRALDPNESIAFQRASASTAEVDDATGPQVIALDAFAALAALLGLVVVSQAVSRRMQSEAFANPTLAAMGMTRPQRMAASLAKTMLAVVGGTLLALVVAAATSGLGPVGVVRVAEVHPGVTFDWPLLLAGAAGIIVLGALLAALPAWHWSRSAPDAGTANRSGVAAAVAAAGGSLAAVLGIRFALESGSRRASVPVRTTLLAAATAVGLVTSMCVFSVSLDHLAATPELYGVPWNGLIDLDNLNVPNGFGGNPSEAIMTKFVDSADDSGAVARSSLVDVGEIRSGTAAIPALGLRPGRHPIELTVAGGRAPRSPDEVALGQTTMDELHTRIGATIPLALGERGAVRDVRVVGRAVLPGLAPYPGSDKAGLGVGALLTHAGWKRFSSDYQKVDYVFRWRAGKSDAALTAGIRRLDPSQLPLTITPADSPAGVVSLVRLRSTPTLLGTLVVVLLGAAVANALVIAVRRRRRDLAVLRTLGFTTGQVVRTVLWQASTVGVVAILIGVPLGVIVGRWTWTLLTEHLGIVPDPLASVAAVAAVVVAVLGLSNAVGLVPGFRAARRPGEALRAE